MSELAAALGGLGVLAFAVVLLFWDAIATMWIVREIRKQAQMLPEDRREEYLRGALESIDRAAQEQKR